MLTQDAFEEHKQDYTIRRKVSQLDRYNNETNTFIDGGTIHVMWVPVSDEATIQTFGESSLSMNSAVVYEDTEISEHDQVQIGEDLYEFVSIKKYPSYKQVVVRKINERNNNT